MLSVFDVSTQFVDRAGGKIEATKLEKLCFYAFGWYAHLTGEPLFSERFYAMQHGPVVGDLLTAHAGLKEVDQDVLSSRFAPWETEREEPGGYIKKVIDCVWGTYGSLDAFDLAEYSHKEKVWQKSWKRRPKGSKRADLPHRDLISYFLAREPQSDEVPDLPPAMLTVVKQEILDTAERSSSVHHPFIEAIRKQRAA
ncbi:Uncharacterized phage-associated protein [Actinobaculum suis]|uniref:DUF4065 domain-containing protein n=1 Tax=Actinobaculum suis TaxID=1657 RepID=A0A1G7ABT5_9ACTO|nr:type II toxin-antitoxin system antitoxin SocA domain-containing protein [Actinobaculum suis]MDY5152615.1 DUF4065 domain-containing protein [Actinobaculum suis]SDE12261.1 Uncharacterized phage-associated protein [Actinobaculum suis]